MKHCITCNKVKPFDPTAKKGSKASGFMGSECWTCYVIRKRTGITMQGQIQIGRTPAQHEAYLKAIWDYQNQAK